MDRRFNGNGFYKHRPTPEQPGTLGQQIAAVTLSLYLAQRRCSTAAAEWQDARALVIPHAQGDDER